MAKKLPRVPSPERNAAPREGHWDPQELLQGSSFMHKLSSSDHPVSPQQDTEVWEKRKEKGDVQRQVLPLGLEPPLLLQPQHREPQGGFHAAGNKRLKAAALGHPHPFGAWTELKSSHQIN